MARKHHATTEACETAFRTCFAVSRPCGGFAGFTCETDEYCAYQPGDQCGAADASSFCMPRPQACPEEYDPVCGCDGETHSNACFANMAGTGVLASGPCE